jgi:hypothetical protein
MIVTKTRKWGNSIGVVLPKQEVERLRIKENQEITIDIAPQTDPFRELFNTGGRKKIGRAALQELRRDWER